MVGINWGDRTMCQRDDFWKGPEMACCVRGYQVYKDIWAAAIRKVLVCSRKSTNVGKISIVKLYPCKKISYVFCVWKYFYNEKKQITVLNTPMTILMHCSHLHSHVTSCDVMWLTLRVMRHVMYFLLSPMTITLLRNGTSSLMRSSMGTGAMFSPPDVMMISGRGTKHIKHDVINIQST